MLAYYPAGYNAAWYLLFTITLLVIILLTSVLEKNTLFFETLTFASDCKQSLDASNFCLRLQAFVNAFLTKVHLAVCMVHLAACSEYDHSVRSFSFSLAVQLLA